MSSDRSGPSGRVPAAEGPNIYALVTYIPAPLGRFLDALRRELVPHDDPRAHISLLPPRPLTGGWREAWVEVQKALRDRRSFDVELAGIKTFPVTDVVYLEVGAGARELCEIHAAMNTNSLAFTEPFAYHPHVTLAQDIPGRDIPRVRQLAEERWREFSGPRGFRAERAVFVQNTTRDHWLDLAAYELGSSDANL
jgi:2'-5' RNA ligase